MNIYYEMLQVIFLVLTMDISGNQRCLITNHFYIFYVQEKKEIQVWNDMTAFSFLSE